MPDASPTLVYADTSAIVKLLYAEPESDTLRAWLTGSSGALVSSALLEVEIARAVARAEHQGRATISAAAPAAVSSAIDLIDIDAVIVKAARDMPEPYLRALDAIHLATAQSLGRRLTTLLTYDVRQIQAAQTRAIAVVSPA